MRKLIAVLFLGTLMTGCPGQTTGGDDTGLVLALLASKSSGSGSPAGATNACGYKASSTGTVWNTGLVTANTSYQSVPYQKDSTNYWNTVTKVTGFAIGDKITWYDGISVDLHTNPLVAIASLNCPIDTSLSAATGLTSYYDATNHFRSLVATSAPTSNFSVVMGCKPADCPTAPSNVQVIISKFPCAAGQVAIQAINAPGNTNGTETYKLWSGAGCAGSSTALNSGNSLAVSSFAAIECVPQGTYSIQAIGTATYCSAVTTAMAYPSTYYGASKSGVVSITQNVYNNF